MIPRWNVQRLHESYNSDEFALWVWLVSTSATIQSCTEWTQMEIHARCVVSPTFIRKPPEQRPDCLWQYQRSKPSTPYVMGFSRAWIWRAVVLTSSVGGDNHSKSILKTITLLSETQMECHRFHVSNYPLFICSNSFAVKWSHSHSRLVRQFVNWHTSYEFQAWFLTAKVFHKLKCKCVKRYFS